MQKKAEDLVMVSRTRMMEASNGVEVKYFYFIYINHIEFIARNYTTAKRTDARGGVCVRRRRPTVQHMCAVHGNDEGGA